MVIIPVEAIIERNRQFTGNACSEERGRAVGASFAGICYYATLEEQIASIVTSLVKGHFFIDGNKRIALFVYLILAELNKIGHIEDNTRLADLFVEMAASSGDVNRNARLLFPAKE